MISTINGSAWLFGDNVDTDTIISSQYMISVSN